MVLLPVAVPAQAVVPALVLANPREWAEEYPRRLSPA